MGKLGAFSEKPYFAGFAEDLISDLPSKELPVGEVLCGNRGKPAENKNSPRNFPRHFPRHSCWGSGFEWEVAPRAISALVIVELRRRLSPPLHGRRLSLTSTADRQFAAWRRYLRSAASRL